MLGVIFLFAFGAMLFTLLFDPEDRLPLVAAVPLLATTLITGMTETWGNYVHVDCRGILRVNWAGLTRQYIAIQDITGVYRQDEVSWFGRERPYLVVESTRVQIHLGINIMYRDGGWPVQALAQIAVALAKCGAPVDESLAADAYAVTG